MHYVFSLHIHFLWLSTSYFVQSITVHFMSWQNLVLVRFTLFKIASWGGSVSIRNCLCPTLLTWLIRGSHLTSYTNKVAQIGMGLHASCCLTPQEIQYKGSSFDDTEHIHWSWLCSSSFTLVLLETVSQEVSPHMETMHLYCQRNDRRKHLHGF